MREGLDGVTWGWNGVIPRAHPVNGQLGRPSGEYEAPQASLSVCLCRRWWTSC